MVRHTVVDELGRRIFGAHDSLLLHNEHEFVRRRQLTLAGIPHDFQIQFGYVTFVEFNVDRGVRGGGGGYRQSLPIQIEQNKRYQHCHRVQNHQLNLNCRLFSLKCKLFFCFN